jgi:hypothetical protein
MSAAIRCAPGSLFRSTVVTGDSLEEPALSFSLPVPSSSEDCRLDDLELMPDSCTRTNCEFGASMVDGGCSGRSNTTLGMKFLRIKEVGQRVHTLCLLAHLKRPTVT